jgi:crossover junction endodeoxyribonuclease RusA
VISREGRAYRRDVCALLRDHSSNPLDGRLHVRVVLQPPTRRGLDIDNRMKALLDSLEHARIYHDDGQIDRLGIERGEVFKGGKAIVEIMELPS